MQQRQTYTHTPVHKIANTWANGPIVDEEVRDYKVTNNQVIFLSIKKKVVKNEWKNFGEAVWWLAENKKKPFFSVTKFGLVSLPLPYPN